MRFLDRFKENSGNLGLYDLLAILITWVGSLSIILLVGGTSSLFAAALIIFYTTDAIAQHASKRDTNKKAEPEPES